MYLSTLLHNAVQKKDVNKGVVAFDKKNVDMFLETPNNAMYVLASVTQ